MKEIRGFCVTEDVSNKQDEEKRLQEEKMAYFWLGIDTAFRYEKERKNRVGSSSLDHDIQDTRYIREYLFLPSILSDRARKLKDAVYDFARKYSK